MAVGILNQRETLSTCETRRLARLIFIRQQKACETCFPRLKEWAYAGTFFNMTGAAASYAVVGENVGTLILLILAVLTLASWVLRPPGRTLGVLSWA
jgi:hypothetical protein